MLYSKHTPYQAVDCGFYDYLELWALREKEIVLKLELGNDIQIKRTVIKTLITQAGEEFAQLSDGSFIRLDLILEVDNLPVTEFIKGCRI